MSRFRLSPAGQVAYRSPPPPSSLFVCIVDASRDISPRKPTALALVLVMLAKRRARRISAIHYLLPISSRTRSNGMLNFDERECVRNFFAIANAMQHCAKPAPTLIVHEIAILQVIKILDVDGIYVFICSEIYLKNKIVKYILELFFFSHVIMYFVEFSLRKIIIELSIFSRKKW